ncbi:hypothetical protein [Calothrix sp. 336/3]|uniref:hypothetical protein n=1 Tax=Calothrix sp. 336/3 TaxID=1337936 RepID=UPI0004E370CB|nr:hypothetical protein [Calothrix sp. 336/3]AKG20250.1 hypothetical protein IJ00_02025 [Calothrix sp. 336/3]
MSDKSTEKNKKKNSEGGYQTPIDEAARHTGLYAENDARETAKPESASGKTDVEGAPNQGTESR